MFSPSFLMYNNSKLTKEKYLNRIKICRIIRLLAEGLQETSKGIESTEVYKRFEKERKVATANENAADYISFLLRNNEESKHDFLLYQEKQ